MGTAEVPAFIIGLPQNRQTERKTLAKSLDALDFLSCKVMSVFFLFTSRLNVPVIPTLFDCHSWVWWWTGSEDYMFENM